MSPDLRLVAAAIERAGQRISWALAAVTHGTPSGAELEIDRARAALDSAARVLVAETDERHLQLSLPLGGER